MFNIKNKTKNPGFTYNVTQPIEEADNTIGRLNPTKPIKPLGGIVPIKLETEIEIRTTELEMKAKGYDAESIVEMIYAALGVPSSYFETIDPKTMVAPFSKPMSEDKLNEIIDGFEKSMEHATKEPVEKPIDIDMTDLKQKVRLPRTSNNFRCPHCGQAFITKVEGNGKMSWIFRNISSDKANLGEVNIHGIQGIDIESTEKKELIELYQNLSELKSNPVVLVYKDGEDCYCPLCNNLEPLKDWISAYDSPLDYFANEIMCDICGDEANLVMTETSSFKECSDRCLSKVIKKEEDIEDIN